MRAYQQLTAILFAAVGAFMIVAGYKLKLQGQFGPGPGFMAFIVGILLVAVSLLWLLEVSMQRPAPFAEDALPEPGYRLKAVGITAALVVFAAIFTVIGFRLAMLAFLSVAFVIFGRDHLAAKVVVAIACSFGFDYIFERLLLVPLPSSSIKALAALGF